MVVKIKPGIKALVGADLSGAELRAAVQNCQDPALVACYNEGRDLYSLVGSMAYNCSYEEACEFYPEGTEIEFQGQKVITGYKTHTNYRGKIHRSAAKKIAIGLVYSRGAASIAEQIGEPLEKGKEILDNVNKGFPMLKEWMDRTKAQVIVDGYTDDYMGRRRHLPNAQLPRYEIRYKIPKQNPLMPCHAHYAVDDKTQQKYISMLENAKSYREAKKIKEQIDADGYILIDNQSKIAEAQREAPNWMCQSATANWIKLNMIAVANDPELNSLGAKLLLTIHDELQMECPLANAEAVKNRLTYLMSNTCKDLLCIPLPSDGTIEMSGKWYMGELETVINDHFNKYTAQGMSKEDAYKRICEEESELLPENIYNFLFKGEYLR